MSDFVIIVGFLLDALGGRGPHPVLIFTGEPGATKTTHAKMARLLTDPNTSPVRSPPKELRDVYIAATKGAVLAYDNLSSLPDWLSDALCVITEGSSDSRRELFSDDDESDHLRARAGDTRRGHQHCHERRPLAANASCRAGPGAKTSSERTSLNSGHSSRPRGRRSWGLCSAA